MKNIQSDYEVIEAIAVERAITRREHIQTLLHLADQYNMSRPRRWLLRIELLFRRGFLNRKFRPSDIPGLVVHFRAEDYDAKRGTWPNRRASWWRRFVDWL